MDVEGERAVMVEKQDHRSVQVETILREWLAEPNVAVICGRWNEGAVMELMPQGRACLLGRKYDGCFARIRELRIDGEEHHVHIDLSKLCHVVYAIAASVCYGFLPSFEVHFVEHWDERESGCYVFGLSVCEPYKGGRLRRNAVVRYFRRLVSHSARWPENVHLRMEAQAERVSQLPKVWREIYGCFCEAAQGRVPVGVHIESPVSLEAAFDTIIKGTHRV